MGIISNLISDTHGPKGPADLGPISYLSQTDFSIRKSVEVLTYNALFSKQQNIQLVCQNMALDSNMHVNLCVHI